LGFRVWGLGFRVYTARRLRLRSLLCSTNKKAGKEKTRQSTCEERRVGRAAGRASRVLRKFVGLAPPRTCQSRASLFVLLEHRVEVRVHIEQLAQRLLVLGAVAGYHMRRSLRGNMTHGITSLSGLGFSITSLVSHHFEAT
jgi:hypothetical protein